MPSRSLLRKGARVLLRWIVRGLYGARAAHLDPAYVCRLAFFQKIVGVNRQVPWVVHFSSLVTHFERIALHNDLNPGYSPGCYIQATNGIRFGRGVRIGPNVAIVSANHSLSDYTRYVPASPIEIGDDVWIGANSVILPGAKIGAGTVVGAGSVVVGDLPAGCVAVGNPCRPVKSIGSKKGTS